MKNAAALRITIHCCLIFALALIIPPLVPESCVAYYAITALILIASLLAVHTKFTILRVLLALVPFAGLLLVPKTPAALIVGALPCVYAAAQLIGGRFYLEEWRFKREAKALFIAVCALFVVFLFVAMIRVSLVRNGTIKDPDFIPVRYEPNLFLIAAILLGIIALRCVRAGNIRSARWQLGNIGYFIVPLAVALVAGIGLNAFIRNTDFRSPIEGIANMIASCSDKGVKPGPEITPYPREQLPVSFPSTGPQNAEEWEYSPDPELHSPRPARGSKQQTFNLLYVLAGILAASLIAVIVFKGRRIEKNELIEDDTEREEEDNLVSRVFKNRRRTKSGFGNADRIRDLYRRYITFLKMQGVTQTPGTTSEELSEKSREMLLDEQPDVLLRSLYLRARYEGADMTDEDVALAKQAYEKIVENAAVKKNAQQEQSDPDNNDKKE